MRAIRPKLDGAKEKVVMSEVRALLVGRGFMEPKAIAHVGQLVRDAAMRQSLGFYFQTQIAKTGAIDRGAFARIQQQSAGIPDIWIRKHSWPPMLWLAVELKARRSSIKISAEQLVLSQQGATRICNSAAEVLQAIADVDKSLEGRRA